MFNQQIQLADKLGRREFIVRIGKIASVVVATPYLANSAYAFGDPTLAGSLALSVLRSQQMKEQLKATLSLIRGTFDTSRTLMNELRNALSPANFVYRDRAWVDSGSSDAIKFHRSQAAAAVPSNGVGFDKVLQSDKFSVCLRYAFLPLVAPLDLGTSILTAATNTIDNVSAQLDGLDINQGETTAIDKARSKVHSLVTPGGLREPIGEAQKEALQKDIFENSAISSGTRDNLQKQDCLYRRLMIDGKNQTRVSGFMFQEKQVPQKKAEAAVPTITEKDKVLPNALKQWFVMVPDLSTNKAGYAYNRHLLRLLDEENSLETV